MKLAPLAAELAAGRTPDGVDILKRNPVRCAARAGDTVIKVLLRRPHKAAREAHCFERAHALGIPVPQLIGAEPGWVATTFLEGRAAESRDLAFVLPAVERMHDAGMLHGDLHLGNIWIHDGSAVFLDVQKARFWPSLPGLLRNRELGYLAYSFGSPLPEVFEPVRRWRDRRAQAHWRSRTKRCTTESSGFTALDIEGARGFRRREVERDSIASGLEACLATEPIKSDARATIYRHGGWILKRHARSNQARSAWICGHGLEVRGIATGRALAWCGDWLVMEDAGESLIDWVERDFGGAPTEERERMADQLGDLLGRLHSRGIYHADLKANNITWCSDGGPRLLDYSKVQFGRGVSRAHRIENLAQLNAALPDSVPADTRERALSRYLETLRELEPRDRLKAAVVRESLSRKHRWSGC